MDPESNVAREVARQECVQGIVRTLHAAVRDGADYRTDFHGLAMVLLYRMAPPERGHRPAGEFYVDTVARLVDGPILAFTDSEEEIALLRLKVFESVFGSYASGIHQAMLRVEMGLPRLKP